MRPDRIQCLRALALASVAGALWIAGCNSDSTKPRPDGVYFNATSLLVPEMARFAHLRALRQGDRADSGVVTLALSEGSAHATEDFLGGTRRLTFRADAETSKVDVYVVPDSFPEEDETFHATLDAEHSDFPLSEPKTITITVTDHAVDFHLPDLNPNSPTFDLLVSPRDERGKISVWYFGHAG